MRKNFQVVFSVCLSGALPCVCVAASIITQVPFLAELTPLLFLEFRGCLEQAEWILLINHTSHGESWCRGGTFLCGITVCRLGIVPGFL